MRFWISCLVFCFFLALMTPLNHLKFIVDPLQKFCVHRLSQGEFRQISQGLVCGQDVSQPQLRHWLQSLGLMHIVVASAAQVHWIARFTGRVPGVSAAALVAFALMSGAQPPIVRALCAWGLQRISQLFVWNRSGIDVFLLSLFLSLAGSWHWVTSLSWHLTVAASCAVLLHVRWGVTANPLLNLLTQQLLVLTFLLPYSLAWNQMSLTSILANLLLGSILSLVLFPLSLFSLLIPQTLRIVDVLMSLLFRVTQGWVPQTQGVYAMPSAQMKFVWTATILCLAVIFFRRKP